MRSTGRRFCMPKRRKIGRPTKYRPEFPQQLLDFIKRGGSTIVRPMIVSGGQQQGSEIVDHPIGQLPARFEGFCRSIDISEQTFDRWQETYPLFREAYQKSKVIQREQILQGMTSGVYQVAGAIFDLKNNHGYRDRHDFQTDVTITIVHPPDWNELPRYLGVRDDARTTLPAPPHPSNGHAVGDGATQN